MAPFDVAVICVDIGNERNLKSVAKVMTHCFSRPSKIAVLTTETVAERGPGALP